MTDMIESLKRAAVLTQPLGFRSSASHEAAHEDAPEPTQEQAGEAASLSGAIQRLIGDRDIYKARASAQELELARLRAVNEELRQQQEQLSHARDHYARLATEMLTTLKHIDSAIHDVVQGVASASGDESRSDEALISLARRLSPRGFGSDDAGQTPAA